MSEETIVAICPHCGAEYTLPREYLGQSAECESCHQEFVIEDKEAATVPLTKPQDGDDTATTRMPRMAAATMIPIVEDKFKLDVVKSSSAARKTAPQPPPKPKKAWWQFWK